MNITELDYKNLRLNNRYLQSFCKDREVIMIHFYTSDMLQTKSIDYDSLNYFLDGETPIIDKTKGTIINIINQAIDSIDFVKLEDIGVSHNRIVVYFDLTDNILYIDHEYYIKEVSERIQTTLIKNELKLFKKLPSFLGNTPSISFEGFMNSRIIHERFDDTSISVPSIFIDWCLDKLDDIYPGWDLDDGSKGKFVIDTDKKTIELYFYNYEYNEKVVRIYKLNYTKNKENELIN